VISDVRILVVAETITAAAELDAREVRERSFPRSEQVFG
jgi:hypothetical protein